MPTTSSCRRGIRGVVYRLFLVYLDRRSIVFIRSNSSLSSLLLLLFDDDDAMYSLLFRVADIPLLLEGLHLLFVVVAKEVGTKQHDDDAKVFASTLMADTKDDDRDKITYRIATIIYMTLLELIQITTSKPRKCVAMVALSLSFLSSSLLRRLCLSVI